MIRFKSGDIFKSDADALVNTVNCFGVMGRGLALQFKIKFPQNFKEYKQACDHKEVKPGRMFIHVRHSLSLNLDPPRFIVNFPTKRHWKNKSKIVDIEEGLVALRDEIETRHISSIAIPPLGCDLGGLDWSDVRLLIKNTLSSTSAEIVIYEPNNVPDASATPRTNEPPKMTTTETAMGCHSIFN